MKQRDEIDWFRVFERVPEIVGLEDLRRRCGAWEGRYYLNRERHPYKRDKLKIKLWNRCIWLHEQGGGSMSLPTWLIEYGGAADYADAYRIIEGGDRPILKVPEFSHAYRKEVYVPQEAYEREKGYGFGGCPLFVWMAGLFGEERVRGVWERYRVTTDAEGLAVFWYTDAEGRICYDKRMRYRNDGHRDKGFGGTRRYRTADGYTARPYFGAHLVKGGCRVAVVESEKTALLFALATGRTVVATGGKNTLRGCEENMVLFPDMDAVSEWEALKGANVYPWWNGVEGLDGHSDVGDVIVGCVEAGNAGWIRALGVALADTANAV